MATQGETVLEPLVEAGELERYADSIVRSCLAFEPGDLLVVDCDLAHRELAVALAEAAYRAGAREVDVVYGDRRVQAARIRHARDEHLGHVPPWVRKRIRVLTEETSACVTITGEGDPTALEGLPPERVALDFGRSARTARRSLKGGAAGGYIRWAGVGWPTPAWAAQAYPELDPAEGQRALARDLLHFCRLGPDDPPGLDGWRAHTARLAARNEELGALGLERLELRAPGTELAVRLVPGGRWLGGPRRNHWGRTITPNFPTEENFTSPDPAATEGTFRCTRPLSFRGPLVEGIAGELRGGRLVRLEASDEAERDLLAGVLDTDRGAGRLGEVALVDRSSRIGRAGRVYWNTLIDENAVAHVAFGLGFAQTRPEGTGRLNRSAIHVDVMIGSDELEVTGVRRGGERIALIADGAWQVP
jgi:aminopeptidase